MKKNTLKKINFFDTSSLLMLTDAEWQGHFTISSITLQELENIKTSSHKDFEIKYKARQLTKRLNKSENWSVVLFQESYLKPFKKLGFEITNDIKILSCALAAKKQHKDQDVCFYTNDLNLQSIANLYFDEVFRIEETKDDYLGYKEIIFDSPDETAQFYQNMDKNIFDLNTNEYLILKDEEGAIIDRLCWTGEEHRAIKYGNFSSKQFGNIKPFKGDVQQQCFADSLMTNKLTLVRGKAGSGKSLLSLAFLFHELEEGRIEKVVIFCNTVAVKGAARLG